MTLISAALLLFFVMDALGNVPLFFSALKHVEPSRQRRIVLRELIIALAIMVGFLFLGQPLLSALQISDAALSVAGGVILILIALRMIFPNRTNSLEEEVEGEPFVVPLAIPYVAGPSVLATELLLMSREPQRWPEWLLAVFIAWLASGIILYFASRLRRHLGHNGLVAVERLMGMVLITVAVQMLMTGIDKFASR